MENAMKEEVVKGKVVHKEGRYFLDVAGKMEEIPIGLLADEGDLKELAGKDVEVFYATPKPVVVAIGRRVIKKVPILCNIPATDLIGSLVTKPSLEMIRTVTANLIKAKVITNKIGGLILKDLG